MDNFTDPLAIMEDPIANLGQQITVAGFNMADVPIAIIGTGIACGNPNNSDLGVQIVSMDISCPGQNDGAIIAKGNNGVEPYQYNWSTGDTLSTLENLPPGTYGLTVTDANGDSIIRSVTLNPAIALTLTINTVDATDAMNTDGSAIPIVGGGVAPYQFEWSTGATDSLLNNLLPGDYSLLVTDANGCEISRDFTINSMDCPTIDVMIDRIVPNCPGASDGRLEVNPITGEAPFTFLWERGDTTQFLDNIAAGTYLVTITDANGCTMNINALLADAEAIVIELTAETGEGMNNGRIESMVSGGLMPYEYAWSNGSTEPTISDLGSGVFDLTVTDSRGCEQVASAIIDPQNCSLGLLDTFGTNITLDTINCLEEGSLCLPIPLDSIGNYTLFFDEGTLDGNVSGCRFDTFFAYTYFTLPGMGDLGPYELDSWTINGELFSGTFEDISALVDSMNTWDVVGQWVLDASILIIQGGHPANVYGQMVIQTPLTSSTTTIDLNTNLTPIGTLIEFSSGTHELILVDNSTTCSDTLRIIQPCTDSTTTERDTIIVFNIGEGDRDSLFLHPLFGENLIISENLCPENSDGNAMLAILTSSAIFVAGILEGTDEFCFTILDENGETINVTVIVNVGDFPDEIICESFIALDTFVDQIIGCQNFELCLPLEYDSLLTYGITDNGASFMGVAAECDNGNGSLLSFPTAKTHQLIFTNSQGCQDTSTIVIHAPNCDDDLVLINTVELDGEGQACIEFTGLPGPFQTITDVCPEKNGEMAIYTIDGLTGCVNFVGVELGTDTACIAVCNVYGFCDTIPFIVHVINSDLPPMGIDAVDDSTTTTINEDIIFNAFGNDVFPSIDEMFLVSQPDNGVATFNLDGTIRFEPNLDFCNDTIPEVFEYAICLEEMCDTATVSIIVECSSDKPFFIYNALSPNGDDINEVFQIDGIEQFPNNKVQIFNRWGNMVYQMAGYKNEWSGNWGPQGELLPDGTYFYLIDTGEGELFSGYLEIKR